MHGSLLLGVSILLAGWPPASAQEVAAPQLGSKIWVGHHAEFAEYLRTAPIDRVEDVGEGVTKPQRAVFTPGGLARWAVVKRLRPGRQDGYWESYKSEIAAYELDRILGLDMVPVTVERQVEGRLASVQLWVEGCRTLKKVPAPRRPLRPQEWAKQVLRQRVFDILISNIDRNAGNVLVDGDWNIILIDHSRAFAEDKAMPFEEKMTRLDRELFARLKALDEATLTQRLEPWLFDHGSVRAILARRDWIVNKLESLARQRGEVAVFPF
jgi:hypothetical protein